ncbi:MAG: hypothetical protein CL916_05070 [Deltaproteobacteria bacterium]|nr:hypothetical protein [Deltaproteobacteria bacterium]
MQSKSYLVLKNGVPSQEESIPEHHVFTTIRVYMGKVLLWDWHEERLIHDTKVLGTSWVHSRIEIIKDVAQKLQMGALRITCTVDAWWIHAWETSINESKPLHTCWVEWEHLAPISACVKHGYRSFSRQLTKEKKVDVLLWKNTKEEVLEASFGNLFSIVDGCIYTPPAQGDILDGIGRRTVLHVAKKIGMDIKETPVFVRQGGWWMTSALRGLQRLDISTDDDCIVILREEIERFLLSSFVRNEYK